jgi:hypothetical protein
MVDFTGKGLDLERVYLFHGLKNLSSQQIAPWRTLFRSGSLVIPKMALIKKTTSIFGRQSMKTCQFIPRQLPQNPQPQRGSMKKVLMKGKLWDKGISGGANSPGPAISQRVIRRTHRGKHGFG